MLKDQFRAFFAIDLPCDMKKVVSLWQQRLLADEGRKDRRAIKWVKPENLHLTLCFLGNITTEQYLAANERVKKAAKELSSFTLKLIDLKLFPSSKRPRFLAFNVVPLEPLKTVACTINRAALACGISLEPREFKPHITLGVLGGKVDRDLLLIPRDMKNMSFKVTTIKLFKSEAKKGGSVYTPVAIYKLT